MADALALRLLVGNLLRPLEASNTLERYPGMLAEDAVWTITWWFS